MNQVFLRFVLSVTILCIFDVQLNLSHPYCTLEDIESLEGKWIPAVVWQPTCNATPFVPRFRPDHIQNRICNQSVSEYVVPIISNCRLRDLSPSLVACAKAITENRKYIMAGDSLTGQSMEALRVVGLSSLSSFESMYQFPYLRYLSNITFHIEDVGVLLHPEVEHYIASATPNDVLIYNSGAWWSNSALRNKELFSNERLERHTKTTQTHISIQSGTSGHELLILDLYERSLILLAKTMKEAGLTLVLRATFPAIHISDAPAIWSRRLFSSYNRIMKQVAKDFGVIYIDIGNLLYREDIQLHIFDDLHYCVAYVDPEKPQDPCRWSSAFHLFQRVYMHLMIEIEQTVFNAGLPPACRVLIE